MFTKPNISVKHTFSDTISRLAELEKEKENLVTDNEVKLEVVTQTTKEVGELRQNISKLYLFNISF